MDLFEIDILSGIPLFEGLSTQELKQIQPWLQIKSLPAYAPIVVKNEVGSNVYIILQGTVKVYTGEADKDYRLLSIMGPGETLGEINAADGIGHSAHALTLESSILLCLSRERFTEFVHSMPALCDNLLRLLARRLRLATARSQALSASDIQCRLARLLLSFADQFAHDKALDRVLIPLRFTPTDIAAMIEIDGAQVGPLLGAMQHLGLISTDAEGRIIVLSRSALLPLCAG